MDSFIIVQALGIMTLIISVITMQQRKKENFLLIQAGGTVLFIVQYILTGRFTGAVIFSIVLVRGLVYYFYAKKNLKPSLTVLIAFQILIIISTYFTWQNLLSLVPFIATAAKTWGTWQDDMKWTRRTSLFGQLCMIAYNLSAAMYTGALTEVCNVVSTIVAMRRFDYQKDAQ